MLFLSAGWLWLLLPWSALAAWSWRRPADVVVVPARFLWRDDRAAPASFAPRRPPPLWAICLLLAALLGILALAGPVFSRRAVRVLILSDPSVALDAVVGGRTLRESLTDRATAAIPPDAIVERRVAGEAIIAPARVTARPTTAMLRAAIDEAAGRHDVIVVLTDQSLQVPNVCVLAPATPWQNAGIERASLRQVRPVEPDREASEATAQLMVRVARFGPAGEATLRVTTAGVTTDRVVPADRATEPFFIDLPRVGDRVDVRLLVDGDPLPIDDTATLLKASSWPRLIVEGGVPEVARRLAAAHTVLRPADATSPGVTLGDRLADPREPAVIFAATPFTPVAGPVVASDHPILHGIDVDRLFAGPSIAAAPVGDWAWIATVGGRPAIGVRERPQRQAWIGLDLAPLAEDVGAVVLLANAIAWVGGDAEPTWTARLPLDVGRDWRRVAASLPDVDAGPGIYRDGTGREVAVNVPVIVPGGGRDVGDLGSACVAARRRIAVPVAPILAILAAGLILLAAWLMPRRPRLDAPRAAP